MGYQFLMQGSGLGGLRCNTISLPFYNVSRVKQLSKRESVRDLKGPRSPSFYRDVGSVLKDGQEPTQKIIRSSSDVDDSLDAFEMGETKFVGMAGNALARAIKLIVVSAIRVRN